ncbi:DNA polymerase I [Candidatus Magnetomorum sp. HK-1]|nr:DNA polymerase I [Candidatus Magnetomorum sp. HK-1]
MKKTIYLIDGSAYVYRAYHAISDLSNSKGLPTNAIFGFTRMLIKLIEDKKPDYLIMFFDSKGPTFRHEKYPEYKANRPPMPEDLVLQLPYIRQLVDAFNIPIIEMKGFEADDLIASLAAQAEKNGFQSIMVTGDKDFLQLVTPASTIWDPMKDRTWTEQKVFEKYQLKPTQIIDMMGFWGDKSDNIPGVPSIGEKTATTLIQQFQSMDGVYENIDSITKKKQKEKLIQYKDQAFLSRDLVQIDQAVPISFEPTAFKVKEPDIQALFTLFQTLEFKNLQRKYQPPPVEQTKNYQTILSQEKCLDLLEQIKNKKKFAVDTETTNIDPMRAKLVGISVSIESHEAFYIPVAHSGLYARRQLSREWVIEQFKPILENPDIQKIGQNIKYDWIVLKQYGVQFSGDIFDTMIASYVLHPSDLSHGLDRIALDRLNHQMIKYKDVVGTGKKERCFSEIDLDLATRYACEDADITWIVADQFQNELHTEGLWDLYAQIERPLLPVLVDMETTGIKVDRAVLSDLSQHFSKELSALETKIFDLAGERFNIRSTQQLGTILFEKLQLPMKKKTRKKTAYSTDVNVLTQLAETHELPALILRHRSLDKLKSTYADALIALIHPETARIHTSFNQTATATGRLSSRDPNLQNIPIRTEEGKKIREAFVPEEGCVLLSADYSQIELRIMAHYANDSILIDAFKNNEDIHLRTASEVFQLLPTMITDEIRYQAKAINFGIIYGMGAFRLSKELGISRKMAQTYIDQYFLRYKGVHQFIQDTIASAENTGKTTTLCGRIRHLPDINSKNKNVQAAARRVAVNTPIQGTAADLIKLAMIKVHQSLKKDNFESRMILSVHDEIVLEIPEKELSEVQGLVQQIMENVWDLRVPLKVNLNYGKNWAAAH